MGAIGHAFAQEKFYWNRVGASTVPLEESVLGCNSTAEYVYMDKHRGLPPETIAP